MDNFRQEIFSRTISLIGEESFRRLQGARVLVFGLGGVGSFVVEGLARCGVKHFGLVDGDVVTYSNINRQLIALFSTVGMYKTDVLEKRLRDISLDIEVEKHTFFFCEEREGGINFSHYDYIVDAIDSRKDKLLIAKKAKASGVRLISSMGTGFKTDPSKLKIADIYSTTVCPLARHMRRLYRAEGIESLKVLFSTEGAAESLGNGKAGVFCDEDKESRPSDKGKKANEGEVRAAPLRREIASIAFVPSVAGLMICREVVRDIIEEGDGN